MSDPRKAKKIKNKVEEILTIIKLNKDNTDFTILLII